MELRWSAMRPPWMAGVPKMQEHFLAPDLCNFTMFIDVQDLQVEKGFSQLVKSIGPGPDLPFM